MLKVRGKGARKHIAICEIRASKGMDSLYSAYTQNSLYLPYTITYTQSRI